MNKGRLEKVITEYRQSCRQLEFFDVSCWTGDPFAPIFKQAGLLSQLSSACINSVLVSHTTGRSENPDASNHDLINFIQTDSRLWGVLTLTPQCGTETEIDSYLKSAIVQRIRAVRLYPKYHTCSTDFRSYCQLFESLENLRLPVLLWNSEIDYSSLDKICSDFPHLPFIVEGVGRKLFYDNREHYKFFEKHCNFHLATHNLVNYLGLEDIVRNFGADRLVFGSFSPFQDPNTSMMLIAATDISFSQKQMIAGTNLQNILLGVKAA